MKASAASLFSEAARHHHGVDPHVAAFLGDHVFDRRILGDAVIAPAIPGLDQRRLARDQLRVEGGVVIGEQRLLGLDQQRLGLGDLVLLDGVDRIAEREQRRHHQPAIGRQHGGLALDVVGRLQQIVPAGRRCALTTSLR